VSLREEFLLDPAVVFLNHGSFGACPREVLAFQRELQDRMEREPIRFFVRDLEGLLDEARAEISALVAAAPQDVALVTNATHACNAVLASLELSEGDEVVVTSHGYNAVNNAVLRWCRRATVRTAEIPFPIRSSDEAVAAVAAVLSPRTRLCVIDHVTSPTALVLPVAEIAALARRCGAEVLVDGAHAPGMLDLDVPALGAGYYTGNLHKWVCAPKGAGFLWVRRDLQPALTPVVTSHGMNSTRLDRSRFLLEFDWTGTDDPTAVLSVPAALRFLRRRSGGSLAEHRGENRRLCLAARARLVARLGLEVPAPEDMLGSMATLLLPDRPPHEAVLGALPGYADPLQARLVARGVQVPIVNWPRPESRAFRISAQRYNTLADYEALADALVAEGLGRPPVDSA
jgi:isopenicillin-N epimerase